MRASSVDEQEVDPPEHLTEEEVEDNYIEQVMSCGLLSGDIHVHVYVDIASLWLW